MPIFKDSGDKYSLIQLATRDHILLLDYTTLKNDPKFFKTMEKFILSPKILKVGHSIIEASFLRDFGVEVIYLI